MKKTISKYLSAIGRKGGHKSRRTLTPEQARAMVSAREEKKLSLKHMEDEKCAMTEQKKC